MFIFYIWNESFLPFPAKYSGWRVDEGWMKSGWGVDKGVDKGWMKSGWGGMKGGWGVDKEWVKSRRAIPAMMCMLCFLARWDMSLQVSPSGMLSFFCTKIGGCNSVVNSSYIQKLLWHKRGECDLSGLCDWKSST